MSEPRRGLARDAPRDRLRGIERGDEILDRQGTIHAIGLRGPQGLGPPERNPNFGGGTSPIKTRHTIHERDHGRLVAWERDGYVALSAEPMDGRIYGRQDGKWVVVTAAPVVPGVGQRYDSGLRYDTSLRYDQPSASPMARESLRLPYIMPDAPIDGQGYVRVGLNHVWKPAFSQTQADARYAPMATVSFPESPLDGQAYARRGWDQTWVAVATGTGVPEAPPDGDCYVRCGSTETWRRAFAQVQADQRYALLTQVEALTARVAELEARLAALRR